MPQLAGPVEGQESSVVHPEEDTAQREREEVWTEQAAGVDDGEPRLADAAGHGEAARRKTAEDVCEHVLR